MAQPILQVVSEFDFQAPGPAKAGFSVSGPNQMPGLHVESPIMARTERHHGITIKVLEKARSGRFFRSWWMFISASKSPQNSKGLDKKPFAKQTSSEKRCVSKSQRAKEKQATRRGGDLPKFRRTNDYNRWLDI